MSNFILNKNWLIAVVFALSLTGCLPRSELHAQFSGIHNYELDDHATVNFCYHRNSEPEKTSLISASTSGHFVQLFLPHNTTVGVHSLATDVDRAKNYTIGLKLPPNDRYERGSIFYTEADLKEGTITIDRFDKDYSGGIAGSFEAEFNDGLVVEGEFDIDYRGQGTKPLDFSCFSNAAHS